ncbi:MAG: hypothetical protein M3Z13_07380, partial [Candidatus Dormibacteraeota bacterium]|nr:hypothetical protein [Candidatus Dormibacteraeota bacterium]
MKFLIVIAASFAAAGVFGVTPAAAADSFTCTDRTGGVSGVPGSITALRAAHHDGYDRLVFEFAPTAAGAIPAYHLTQQASAKFTKDPSGMPANLQGSAGLRAGFQNTTVAPGAPTDLQPGLPVIREAAKLGDFERVS